MRHATGAPSNPARHSGGRRGERTGEATNRARDHGRSVSVLVAEDEESFVDALAIGLGREGFDVSVARDGPEALQLFDTIEPDLVLLDIMLPKMSGVDVCRAIRSRSQVPIIMVTAKGTEIDTVVGLEVGADDYVTKPYRLRELVARMRAVLRRAPHGDPAAVHASSPADGGGVLEVGSVRLDPDRHRVFVRGEEVHLRRKEFELLSLLIENAGRVLTRDTLIDRVWGADYVGDTKTLDVHIKRLRSHVEADSSSPAIITTVRGVGYRFEISGDG
jgi:two-component system, OmpR family, response regulator RegX3